MSSFSLYWHTLRYLKPIQLYRRLLFSLSQPSPDLGPVPPRRVISSVFVEPCRRSPTLIAPMRFEFLGVEGEVKKAQDWNNTDKSMLWLYNLHYFDDLNAEGAASRTDWHNEVIDRWIEDNPPGKGVGWDPYPTSLRIVNWIKWMLSGGSLNDRAIHSLAVQVRWLTRRLEWHLLGNHLIANAKALIFAGLFFEGHEAECWRNKGFTVLSQQLREQILQDGGHFERSPMYHLIILEDILDIVNLCRAYNHHVPLEWMQMTQRMLYWAAVMQHPDGGIPFFNDAAFGVAENFDILRTYAVRLGIDTLSITTDITEGIYLADSGYLRLAKGDAVVFMDMAPIGPDYLPAHAHADTLSIELSLFGQRVLVNSGTSVYGTTIERLRQRGTSAHNTVMVNDEDSSEVWDSFRVARRARVRCITWDPVGGLAIAEHEGYRRLRGRPLHRRHVCLVTGVLNVTDTITGDGVHRVQGRWHLHPDIRLLRVHGTSADFLFMINAGGDLNKVLLSVQGPVSVTVENSSWHPKFGCSISNQRIVFKYHGPLPISITTRLQWQNINS